MCLASACAPPRLPRGLGVWSPSGVFVGSRKIDFVESWSDLCRVSVQRGEYPDALVKRGLANEELKNWARAAQDYTKAIDALRPKDGRPDKAMKGDATIQERMYRQRACPRPSVSPLPELAFYGS